jgi:DNA-binding XRE family transcriptional regulator
MARRRADACYRELGAELRKRRIAANLTMRELAYHLDWSPSTVSRVESGYIGLPTTEVLPPPRSSRAIRFSGSAANTSVKAG